MIYVSSQSLIHLVISVAFFALAVWALVEALRHSASQFAFASYPKFAWIGVLAVAVLVAGNRFVWALPIPFTFILRPLAFLAVIYFLAQERRKFTSPARRDQRNRRGRQTPKKGW